MQWVLSPKIFTNAYGQAGGGAPPPYGQPDRKITCFLTSYHIKNHIPRGKG